MRNLLSILVVLSLVSAAVAQQTASIMNSPHNLSASGPGAIRASTEQEVCIFCHTPHNSAPIQPLWNRNMPVSAYTPYTSNSLDAIPGQPTGTSKLCLSCHDGTIALGSVLSRNQGIAMAGGITTLPPGKSNLGTDLSDDHPVSFRYDTLLAARDLKLKNPNTLPQQIALDHNSEMQCTSCHDAHSNRYGKFLVMDNAQSQLCNSCHNVGQTTVQNHVNCSSCHQQHTAPSGPYLLAGKTVSETCLPCHNGGVAPQGADIASAMRKMSRHETNPPVTLKTNIPNDAACNDCHGSHTMQSMTANAPNISPKLGQVAGVNAAGGDIPVASFEYEVCAKCHGNNNPQAQFVSRQIVQNNTLLEFARSAASFHPVQGPGKNLDVPSLRPGLNTTSVIYCSSCHANDDTAAPSATKGPHGSNYRPLLAANYSTIDNTTESASAYALCYSCHERQSILANQSFPFHSLHVVNSRTPCSVCHDAHGISSAQGNTTNNAHLINFDVTVVQRDTVTGLLEYRSTGPGAGACYLSCHGVAHSPKTYTPGAAVSPAAPMPRRR